jgi:hypothetical protein
MGDPRSGSARQHSGMTNDEAGGTGFEVDRRLLTVSAVLIGVGGALGFAGMLLGGSIAMTAGRRYLQQMDASPRELATLKWQQANAASRAGKEAWQAARS